MSDAISVVVPTFRRPAWLRRCLAALDAQTRLPDLVIVVVRNSDDETNQVVSTWSSRFRLEMLRVDQPGVVAALNAALAQVEGDVVAFIDDDTEPHADWLARIEAHFDEDPTLGGLGGRDFISRDVDQPARAPRAVGKVQWFGRTIGNHHLITGPPRDADIIKGANMCYRVSAVRGLFVDERLRGSGAQVHSDMALSLALRKRGYRLLCDPQVAVDHHFAERFDEDARGAPSRRAVADAVHNETLILLEYLRWWQRPVFATWSVLLGTRNAPGLGQWVRMKFWPPGVQRTPLGPSLAGRIAGWRRWIVDRWRTGDSAL